MKPIRVFLGIGIFLLILVAIPLSLTAQIRNSAYSFLRYPVTLSKDAAKLVVDLYFFRKNADENHKLRNVLADRRSQEIQLQELRLENARLTKLLDLRTDIPPSVHRILYAHVILRSALGWNRIVLIDKGTHQGIKPNMLVLSESSVIGKVILAGPVISQVLLIADPKSRLGAVIQRTRQEGLLFGTSSGECHMKYISIDTEIKMGDQVETAGFGGFFPKGIPIGIVKRVWKEPGQIYQVAEVKPFMDLDRIEEVAAIE